MLRLLRVTMLLAFIVGPVALASAQQALPPPLASIAGKDCGGRVLRIGGVVSGAIVWIRLSDDAQGPMAHLYFGGGFGSSAGVVPFSPHPPTNITPADYGGVWDRRGSPSGPRTTGCIRLLRRAKA